MNMFEDTQKKKERKRKIFSSAFEGKLLKLTFKISKNNFRKLFLKERERERERK